MKLLKIMKVGFRSPGLSLEAGWNWLTQDFLALIHIGAELNCHSVDPFHARFRAISFDYHRLLLQVILTCISAMIRVAFSPLEITNLRFIFFARKIIYQVQV